MGWGVTGGGRLTNEKGKVGATLSTQSHSKVSDMR